MPLSDLEVAGERRFVSPDRLVEAAGGVGGLAERIEIVEAKRSLGAGRGEGVVCLTPSAAEERLPASLEQRPKSISRVHCRLILALGSLLLAHRNTGGRPGIARMRSHPA
jgi:hypothetical protein